MSGTSSLEKYQGTGPKASTVKFIAVKLKEDDLKQGAKHDQDEEFNGAFVLAVDLRAPLHSRMMRDTIYDWVARYRYRWFGRRETCILPNPDGSGP